MPRATSARLLLGGLLVLGGCGSSAPAPSDAAAPDVPVEASADEDVDALDAAEAGDAPLDAAPEAAFEAAFEATPKDAAPEDAAPEAPPPPLPYDRPVYTHLAETGLFDDFAAGHVAPDIVAFEPTHKLWSDAAAKRRWIRLPPGTQIDTSDMDHWVFPVGTKLWKEFSLGGVHLETRLIERYGAGPEDYWFGAFVWNADGTDAVFAVDGAQNVGGTPHDVPTQKDCGVCHRGDVGRVLGFSAIQLSRTTNPPALRELGQMGWLSRPPAAPHDLGGYPAPGDAPTAAALGYLHANCGHCHNENGTSWPDTQMVLRLTIADREAATSQVVQSIVGKDVTYWRGGAIKQRVAPGAPDMSAIVARMSARGTKDQMPPFATEIVDEAGLQVVRAWIAALPPP
jgi:hypothetical protein